MVKKNEYKVTILVPIYNVEKYIEKCAISLFEQTYENLEYIFVDDCGQDNSIKILNTVIDKYPHRKEQVLIIRHEHNRGLAAARNTGLAAAAGEFVLHVDSDDYIEKNTVEKIVKKQAETGADLVLFEFLLLHNNYSIVEKIGNYNSSKELCLAQLSGDERHCICGEFIRKSLYTENGISVLESYNMAEDFQVTPRIAFYAKRVAFIHEPLYIYNKTNDNSYTFNFNERNGAQVDKAFEILNLFFEDKGPEYLNALTRSKLVIYIRQMMDICKAGGHDEFYLLRRNAINSIDHKLYFEIPLSRYFFIKLMWCRPLLNILCKLTAQAKHINYKLKCDLLPLKKYKKFDY